MDIQLLAQEFEDLTFENGHVFENGTPFRERLGRERAVGLLRALEAHGYQIVRDNHPHVTSPSIAEMDGERKRETSH